jgi:hypothetical protein
MGELAKNQAKVCVGLLLAQENAQMDYANIKLYRSRGGKRQTCKVCKCPDKFDFNVPDEMWKRVVPVEYQRGVVCLDCFDRFASEKQIDYSDSIEVLYFAGDKATFKFQTVLAQNV